MNTSPPPSRPALSVLPQPPPPFMSSRRDETGGSIRLVLAGELDLAARHHFQADLDEAQCDSDRVVLDLGALTFIDCACLGTLYAAARRADRGRAVLILLGPHGQVRRLLGLVGPPRGTAILDPGDLHEQRGPVAA